MTKVIPSYTALLRAILTGTSSAANLREFFQLCGRLALPLVRKKHSKYKTRISILGLSEQDIVLDCLADLFQRDSEGRFVQLCQYFEDEVEHSAEQSDELVIESLRRIVFQKVNTNFIRLLCEADPVFGKILHNVDVTVERTHIFVKKLILGEKHLLPIGVDPLFHLPPPHFEELQRGFVATVLVHDSMHEILRKAHVLLADQAEHQRTIPLVTLAILVKEAYSLATGTMVSSSIESEVSQSIDLTGAVERICVELRESVGRGYVTREKLPADTFEGYLQTVRDILNDGGSAYSSGISLYEYLRRRLPALTVQEYRRSHRTKLEYLIRLARKSLRREWQNGNL